MRFWKPSFIFVLIMLLLNLMLIVNSLVAFPDDSGTISLQDQQGITIEGVLAIMHVDPLPDSGMVYETVVSVLDDNNQHIILANHALNVADVQQFNGKRVRVTGSLVSNRNGQNDLQVVPASIDFVDADNAFYRNTNPEAARSVRYVNLFCQFPDHAAITSEFSLVQRLIVEGVPSVNDAFKEFSGGVMNVDNSVTIEQIYTMPKNYTDYPERLDGGLQEFVEHCTGAADSDVDFTQFERINFILSGDDAFNASGLAWVVRLTLDGETKTFNVSFVPDEFVWQGLLAHEIGHTFGLGHSYGLAGDIDNPASIDFRSPWDFMSAPGGRPGSSFYNGTSVSSSTNAYHLYYLGLIPEAQIAEVVPGSAQTITLERLIQPNSTTNARIIIVPVEGNENRFYTVELRQKVGIYEQSLAQDQSIVIHIVDDDTAHVIDLDNNQNYGDAGAIWEVGETFTDTKNNIQIYVSSKGESSYEIYVTNNPSSTNITQCPTVEGLTVTTKDGTPPEAPNHICVLPNQGRPTITWRNDPRADWFNVWIGNAKGPVLFDWFPRDNPDVVFGNTVSTKATCEGDVCTLKPDINPTAGVYEVWMQAWGSPTNSLDDGAYSTGGPLDAAPSWNGGTDNQPNAGFAYSATPSGPVSQLTATLAEGGKVSVSWAGVEGATWYNVWLGSAAPEWNASIYIWALAENLGCENGGTCTLTDATEMIDLANSNFTLSTGDYVFYVQSWGPAGFNTGGINGTSWVESLPFTVQ